MDETSRLLDAELARTFEDAATDGRVHVWAAPENETARGQWEAMRQNDLVLFYWERSFQRLGRVARTFYNRELGIHLWPDTAPSELWPYIFIFKDFREIRISLDDFIKKAGYSPVFFPRRLQIVASEHLQRLLAGHSEIEGALSTLDASPGGLGSKVEMERRLNSGEIANQIDETFDPKNVTDARSRVLRTIQQRRGQPQFRQRLLRAYGNQCAVTGCDAVETLEAVHIIPYRGPDTNHPANGLLLRADIHTLFDLRLIAVDTTTLKIVVDPRLSNSVYGKLAGRPLGVPQDLSALPSLEALDIQRKEAEL